MSGVLVVAAHPDDAELAVGGTIARLSDAGVPVTVAVVAVSEVDAERCGLREAAARQAAGILGHRLRWLVDEPLGQVEQVPEYELVRRLDAVLEETRPATVLTHWEGDSHGDHVRVARAVVSATRRWPALTVCQFGPNEHRTPRFAEFTPNVYVPIGAQLDRKVDALAAYAYAGQGFRPLDAAWIRQLAAYHGGQAGVAAAEALRLLRYRLGGRTQLSVVTQEEKP